MAGRRGPQVHEEPGCWLDRVRAVDRSGQAARQAIRVIVVRPARLALRTVRLALRLTKRVAKVMLKWMAFAMFSVMMDVLSMARFRHYVLRPLRRLRASLRHSTDWHEAEVDGHRMEVRRMSGSDCLEIRIAREGP